MSEKTQVEAFFTAINKAQSEMNSTVHKSEKNSFSNYSYVGHEQVISHCQKALIDNGLIVEPSIKTDGPVPLEYKSRNGNQLVWSWSFTISVSHIKGHTKDYIVPVTTQANDKSAFVASTSADRTLRLRLCGLAGSNEEDPEHNSHDARSSEPASHFVDGIDVRSHCYIGKNKGSTWNSMDTESLEKALTFDGLHADSKEPIKSILSVRKAEMEQGGEKPAF